MNFAGPLPTQETAPSSKGADEILLAKFENARKSHLGYPYNLAFDATRLSELSGYLINNLGDPYVGSHYGTEVCEQEREAVEWLMRQWGCDTTTEYWGSVGASGTEGNMWAAYLAREILGDPVLIHSEEAHYSIPKSARILRMDVAECATDTSGAIDLEDFGRVVERHRGRPLLVIEPAR